MRIRTIVFFFSPTRPFRLFAPTYRVYFVSFSAHSFFSMYLFYLSVLFHTTSEHNQTSHVRSLLTYLALFAMSMSQTLADRNELHIIYQRLPLENDHCIALH